jgi:hypothetical protein
MLPLVLEMLHFRSDNRFQPIIAALNSIQEAMSTGSRYFKAVVPIQGVVSRGWTEHVLEDVNGKGVQTRRFKLSNTRFAVSADGLHDRKIEFIAAGNVYYTRREELIWLLKAAEKAGISVYHSTINKSANPPIVRVCSAANKNSSIKSSHFPEKGLS